MNKQNSRDGSKEDMLSSEELTMQRALSSHLDEQVDKLDFNTTSRLNAARHRALAQEQSSREMLRSAWPAMIGGSFAAALVFYIGSQAAIQTVDVPGTALVAAEATSIIEDLTLLSATDDIDFFQSVEFLEWIEMNSG